MNEQDMTLARDWDFRDLSGWFWSEKFDGVRAFWDGEKLWTRGGRVIAAPADFLAQLPAGVPLDGELWAGRGTLTVATNAAVHGIWDERLVFKCFDLPGANGDWLERMTRAESFSNAVVQCCERGVLGANDDPSELAARFIDAGGEGAMFRNPRVNFYQRQRTVNLLRIKKGNLYAPWRKESRSRTAQSQHPCDWSFV